MTNPKYIQVVAAIMERDGKVLIARRREGKSLAGYWEFPGGKVEQGETPEEALKRELLEEFNVQVLVKDFVASKEHKYEHIAIKLIGYRTVILGGKFKLTDHDSVKWVTKEDLTNYQLAPADIEICSSL